MTKFLSVGDVYYMCGVELRNRLKYMGIVDDILVDVAKENGFEKDDFVAFIKENYDDDYLETIIINKLVDLGKLKTLYNGNRIWYKFE